MITMTWINEDGSSRGQLLVRPDTVTLVKQEGKGFVWVTLTPAGRHLVRDSFGEIRKMIETAEAAPKRLTRPELPTTKGAEQ